MAIAARLRQALFRWQSDGSDAFSLGQRRVFILPSRGGLFYALMLLVMLSGAINYNLALGHALVFLLAALGMTGMIHTFRNLHGLGIIPGRTAPVFAGETAQFPITFDNQRAQARPGLMLEAAGMQPLLTAVDAADQRKIALPIPATRRGWLALPRIRLSTLYPLGLFTAWAYLQPEMRCLVYPAPLVQPLPPAMATEQQGEHRGDGGTEDFAGFRERQPSDSLRHVAWKASARDDGRRPLLVKQFAGGARLQLSLDWALTDSTLDDETRLSILTGWVLAAGLAGSTYNLTLPGLALPVGMGETHRQRCLEALALADLSTQ